MLKNIFAKSLRSIAIIYCLSLATHVATAAKEPALDLSIIAQRDALTAYMDNSQRIELLKVEEQIKSAESDIQSSQYLIQTKPSAFRSDSAAKEMVNRGKKLHEAATTNLRNAQVQLIELLQSINTKRQNQLAITAQKFNFSIQTQPYETALTKTTAAVLATARESGYKTIFFDNYFVTNADGTFPVKSDVRNTLYDALIEIDGTHFSVSVPIGLGIDTTAEQPTLSFENIADYKGDKLGLFAIELIQKQGDEGMLYVRVLDLHSHQIIHQQLMHVTGVQDLLSSEDTTVSNTTETAASAPSTATTRVKEFWPTRVKILDEGQWIDRLAQQPYQFEIVSNTADAALLTALLTHTVLNNSELQVVDSDFIARAYGTETAQPASHASAQLSIAPQQNAETEHQFKINAKSYSSNRVIEIGSMTLANQ